MGRMMATGLAEGMRQGEARMAAIPEGVDREAWRNAGIAEAVAALDADPVHQRMMARTEGFWGLPAREQGVAEQP